MTPDEAKDPVQAPAGVPPPPDPPARPKVPGAQLIVNEVVIHQPTAGQAVEVASHNLGSFVRLLDTTEQPVSRDCEAGPDWQPLALWWLDGKPLSQLIVCNREGQFRGGNPTPEQRALVLSRVVEVGVELPVDDFKPVMAFAEVPPHESCRFRPATILTRFMLRCRNGPAKVTVVAVPGDAP